MDWTDLAQDRDTWPGVVNTVTNIPIPQHAENSFTSWENIGFSKRIDFVALKFIAKPRTTELLNSAVRCYKMFTNPPFSVTKHVFVAQAYCQYSED